jgi:deoxyribose-phosphate aldolase
MFSYDDLAKMIDHSLVNPTLTLAALEEGCRIARAYDVATVSAMPFFLPRCTEMLHGSSVKPGTTVGFPHGSHTTAIKVAEAERALRDGADELDMVVNISSVLSGDWDNVRADIRAVVDVAHAAGRKLKVIFENAYLNDEQKIRLCEICGAVNADWVKTSTGYAPTGVTDHDLRLMRMHSPAHVQIKAAGGVRSLDRLLEVRALGVTRVGATRTVEMLEDARRRLGLAPISTPVGAPAPAGY